MHYCPDLYSHVERGLGEITVEHRTTYRYRRAVEFGEHRLMFRPRDSHDMRLLETALVIEPQAEIRWLHDVFTNSIAIARFAAPAPELSFFSRIRLEHYGIEETSFPLAPYAATYPFSMVEKSSAFSLTAT